MRLICGLLRLDGGKAGEATVAAMASTMSPPDIPSALQYRIDGPMALAVLQTGTEQGSVIVTGANGSLLAADVRLDRPGEAARQLGLPPTTSPEALALAGLERWNDALPDRLDGDYALAAWNPRIRQLTLTRDIFAVRPLCFCHLPGRLFAFASLPKAIYGSGLVKPRPDLPSLVRRLFIIYEFGEATGYMDISWLAAGHVLTVDVDGRMRMVRAWRPDPAAVGTWRGTHQEAAATLRNLIRDAVNVRIPATGAVASHLSGGLDSSAVSILAARHLKKAGRRLAAYTFLGAPGAVPSNDADRSLVEAVLDREKTIDCTEVYLAETDPLAIVNTDLPTMDFELANHVNTYTTAASAGARLLLTGAGGDEGATLSAWPAWRDLLRRDVLAAVLEDLPARARLDGASQLRIVLRRVVAPLLPNWVFEIRGRSQRPVVIGFRPGLLLLAPELRAAVSDYVIRHMTEIGRRPEDRIRFLNWGFLQSRNTVWAMMGAHVSLDLVHPLLDRRVVDFALSLPIERLLHGGYSRQPFRDAMEGILPECVRLNRGKSGTLPDSSRKLCAAKPALLAAVAKLRQGPAAVALDFAAIEQALIALPDDPEHLNCTCRRQAVTALRAISLANHLARIS